MDNSLGPIARKRLLQFDLLGEFAELLGISAG
jgi:hypothetical protein